MPKFPEPLDLNRLRVYPLAQRKSLTSVDDILVDPDSTPQLPDLEGVTRSIQQCATQILEARRRGAAVMLIYGAHLLRNGAALILEQMMAQGWITHLATNGAGTIHDWEYAFQGRSTESVRDNVAIGSFGAWDETGRNIHLALLAGGLEGHGYGRALGGFIEQDGTSLPNAESLEAQLKAQPDHPRSGARADLLQAIKQHGLPSDRIEIKHPFKHASILASAFRHNLPLTVHPGIGYDIVSCHPLFDGGVIGRAAGVDFASFCRSVEGLDHGVVLSVGSAIMGPQVFEKSLSCVNNLRLQDGREIVKGHQIYVVDLQDGGSWDWTKGEPPKTNPAYYLRFCKSYSRMGGTMNYLQCDNAAFVHQLCHQLRGL